MNFEFTPEEQSYIDQVHTACDQEIAPLAAEADRKGLFPTRQIQALAKIGYLGLGFPEEFGGTPASRVLQTRCAEEVSRVCASTFLSSGASIGLCGAPINYFGSEEMKRAWLPKLISSQAVGCWGLTEPHCGSDAAAMKTRAVRDGDAYVLNGTKTFITNASAADVAVVAAKTAPEAGHKGVSLFLVEADRKGFSQGKPMEKMGLRGSPTGELIFEDCRIPATNRLGDEGEGFIQAMQVLESGRIGMAAFSVGLAVAALEEAIKYANEREAFGQKIAKHQQVHFKIADMKVAVDVARLLALRAAWMKDQGMMCGTEASVAKLYASEAAMRCAHNALQIHGGYGYIAEFPIERIFRDARLGEIGEGTSEIQRLLIARDVLKRAENDFWWSL